MDSLWNVRLEHASGLWQFRLHQAGTVVSAVTLMNPVIGGWTHMTVVMPLSTDSGTMSTLTYGGMGSSKTTITVTGATLPTTFLENSVGVGAMALTTTTQDYKFYFDNVVVNLQ
jgi:hypothetical protein